MYLQNSNNFSITAEKQGPPNLTKLSFPMLYGKYSSIKTPEYEFIFNLNGEIRFIRGISVSWPHPAELLKRTAGNDWVYYTVGDKSGDQGIISWFGEYYLPCLPYPSNPIWEIDYFSNPVIMNAFAAWSQLYANLYGAQDRRFHQKDRKLIEDILLNNDNILFERSEKLHSILGEPITVLPPDTRHVDYEVIPINISDGCLYHCRFCCVKSAQSFRTRSESDILNQIWELKALFNRNLENYNGLFLGNHDALEAGEELILTTVYRAFDEFGFKTHAITPSLFMFGSVHSFLKAKPRLFEEFNTLPFSTYINIGLESVDKPTLEYIGKPVSESEVREAFMKMVDINNTFKKIDVTANFVIGKELSSVHYESIKELLGDAQCSSHDKGAIYLSPLKDSPKKRELLPLVKEIKSASKLPVYIYLIQRL